MEQNQLNQASGNRTFSRETFSTLMRNVYVWMALALTITAFSALWITSSEAALNLIFGNVPIFVLLVLLQLGLVLAFSTGLSDMSFPTAGILFAVYSFVTGITCSCIFLSYTNESIVSTFFITAGTFAGMSLFGYFTQKDLTSWGQYLMMGLIGIIIASLVNLFLGSEKIMWITTYAGVVVFVGLTAYDTQKIKELLGSASFHEIDDNSMKLALFGSFALYLDFINLFIKLLRIFGKRK